MEIKDLIKKLEETGVRISNTDKNLHWYEIYFESMDTNLMKKVGQVVEDFFRVDGKYTHLLPKFIGKHGQVCLIFDVRLLEKN